MTKNLKSMYLFCLFFMMASFSIHAQTRTIKGVVKDSKTNETIVGATVAVEGTTNATATDINGAFTLQVDQNAKYLVVTVVGMTTKKVEITGDVINIEMEADAVLLKETVVTALGVSREKKTLGYAAQELTGDKLSAVKSGNFVNQMSGKLAGVQIKNSGNFGGSTNIVIRGTSSISGNNQALFVVDGIPLNNSTSNKTAQSTGGAGFDYGNNIGDINPEDIESMTVLKGAAATALYGSRAANGVVMITTKKGKLAASGKQRFGVTFSSDMSMGIVNKSTFPTYQNKYGAGYGAYYDDGPGGKPFFFLEDVNGDGNDDFVVPYTEDASYGAPFDPNLMVYQWDAYVPTSPNYKKATPWVAAKNGPISFFEKALNMNNSVALEGGNDRATFRASYANNNQKGIMPNSTLRRDNFGINASLNATDNLTATISANYVKQNVIGRNNTGYDGNDVAGFRQWWQTNVDMKDIRKAYEDTKLNYGWNPKSSANPTVPIYWDNLYFKRNKSFTSDVRDRFYGNITLNYKINDMFSVMTRFGADQFATLQEERLAVGSVPTGFGVGTITSGSGYARNDIKFREINWESMLNFKKDLSEDLSLTGLLGTSIRRTTSLSAYSSTTGGMGIPDFYSLTNSKEALTPSQETAQLIGVNGFFGNVSLGYKRFVYIDLTARNDYSSTLPAGKNGYFYPGVSTSLVFSELMKNLTWLDFGKLRVNVAQVGKDAPFGSVNDIYGKPNQNWITTGVSAYTWSVANTKNNPNLKPEISLSTEVGLEMYFFKRRLGFDFAMYRTLTKDQIMTIATTAATGNSGKVVNAGKIENKGIELTITGTPVQTSNFSWDVSLNYTVNRNKVIELYTDPVSGIRIPNIVLGTFQQGVTLNATEGQSVGILKGSDFVYLNGKKVVDKDGYYKKSDKADITLGNVNPKFLMGLNNSFTYKGVTASFLIDMQYGGQFFSLDMAYGLATGLYPETAGNNDLGNPVRNELTEGGGVILDGVKEDGSPNDIRADASTYANPWGYETNPNAPYIYDASYVKFREASISYKLPLKNEAFFRSVSFGLIGTNLAILYKNSPYTDPEAGLSAGNIQGYQTGVLPTTRNFGFKVSFQF